MSMFPKRLIEQLDDGHARELLDSAQSDAPSARVVGAALIAASKSAPASTGATSSHEPAPRALAWSRSTLVVGVLLAVGMTAIFVASELRGAPKGQNDVVARPAITIEHGTLDDAPAAVVESIATTSIAELPDAPSVRPPSHRSVATAARPAGVLLGQDESAPKVGAQTADLLREANRLRAQGRWSEAGATYQRVMDLGPDSAEAYPAEIALANLELQQGRSASALAHYEHVLALRPAGLLSEEARWGKARALRAAGRHDEERAALEEFRARHPESPLASTATQRLAEIGP